MSSAFRFLYDGMTSEEIAVSIGKTVAKELCARYGSSPDRAIVRRVQEEWAAMEASREIEDVAALYELTLWLKERQEPYRMCGTTGSSFILYLLGITAGNPLPSHSYCPKCRSVTWEPDCADGFDLPPGCLCEKDGALLYGDGHNIPWQTHWGYDKETSFDIDVPKPLAEKLRALFQSHWLTRLRPEKEKLHRYPDTDFLIHFYHLTVCCILDRDEIDPDFYDITLDASCTLNAVKALDVYLDRMDRMGVRHDVNLRSRQIHTFAGVIAKYGLIHSTGGWDRDTRFMVDRLGYSLPDMIAHRDDVFFYLLSHGLSEIDAWKWMESVRQGHGLPVATGKMSLARDKWVIDRCNKLQYLFPKAHAQEDILFRLRAEGLRSRFAASYEMLSAALQIERGSNVILLGGRPGMGKTTFAKYFAERLSTVNGKKTLIFSQEKLDQKVSIDLIREHINTDHPDFVVFDYLQLIVDYNCGTGKGGKEMAAFMAGIRALADETGVSVLVLSQISRRAEHQRYCKPKIEHIFRSADIIPYVDGVIFLYRESYYDSDARQDQASCIIAKSPSGMTEVVPLFWDHVNIAFDDAVYPTSITSL